MKMRTLYHKMLDQEHRELCKKAIKMAEARPYLVDRILGSGRGTNDGEFKDFPQELAEKIIDTLLFNDLIKLENVKPIPLTQIDR